MMRDYSNGRADRVLMAVAATFLTLSATAAFAQSDQARSPADLAIDAAIPRPEPANLPPPTVNDFKAETTASVSDQARTTEKAAEKTAETPVGGKPAETAAAPAGDAAKDEPASATPAPGAASTTRGGRPAHE